MTIDAVSDPSNLFNGIPASSGVVIGKAYVLDRHMLCILERKISPDEVKDEIERFHQAVEAAQSEMRAISERARDELGEDIPFMIFDAHSQLLQDPSLIKDTEKIIDEKECIAEWALKILLEKFHVRFSKIKDKYFRERLSDIEQVIGRLQRGLIKGEEPSLADLKEPVIIIAHDLSPADTIQMDPSKVIGFATDGGGKTSHAGIIASSMDIPAVVGLKNLSYMVRSGDPIIVDGNTGIVISCPTNKQFIEYNQKRQKYLYYDQEVHAQKHLEAKTTDGITIRVRANIESSHDLKHLVEHGAEGVGLYRTEYLYVNKGRWPDEEEQYQDYKKVAESVQPYHAVIRTLDIGGDKVSAAAANYLDSEPNPALGLRAIRFCLAYPDIFKTQLRAILRASTHGKLKIMYPLITTLEELLEANEILGQVKESLQSDGIAFDESIEVGIMIETPSSVMIADELAKHCSFFSIGTNDLIQYTMAIDRVNERVAYLYQPLSPAILKMLKQAIQAANDNNISISVCGKMAGDPLYVMLLMGLGNVGELSMDVHSIPKIKKFLRSISLGESTKLADSALLLQSEAAIKTEVTKSVDKYFTDETGSGLEENAP